MSSLQRAPWQRRPGAHSPENEKVMFAEADMVALASEQSRKGQAGSTACRHVPVTDSGYAYQQVRLKPTQPQHDAIRIRETGRREH